MIMSCAWSPTSQELRDIIENAPGSRPGSPDTRAFVGSPPRERRMEDGRSHPQIVALLPPGPSNRNVNAMNSLGNLSDDVLLQTVARPPRTYLGAPGNPLAPQNKDSQAALWELSVIFTPEGPFGETWMCCARPREGAAGV